MTGWGSALILAGLVVSCAAQRGSSLLPRPPGRSGFRSGSNKNSFRSPTSIQDVRTKSDDKDGYLPPKKDGYLPPEKDTINVPCGIGVPSVEEMEKESVHLGEYPWMALIGFSNEKRPERIVYNCGGTLINDRYVLTAAHCVRRLPRGVVVSSVRLGEHNITSTEDCSKKSGRRVCTEGIQDYGIEELIPHPDHNKPHRYKNDIALIRLDRPVQRNAFVRPICLPFGASLRRRRIPGTLTVAGFGAVRGQKNDAVRELVVPVVGNVQCTKAFRKYRAEIGDKQLCAGGERGRGACAGDAGGPLMNVATEPSEPTFLVGVVSFGPARCGTAKVPDVYTRVDKYSDWIMANMHI